MTAISFDDRRSNMTRLDKKLAARSLVRVLGKDDQWGMGVYTTAERIVTAAHCLPALPDPKMNGFHDQDRIEPTWVTVRSFHSPNITAEVVVVSVDPCADMAVLDCYDYQEGYDKRPWKALLEKLEPVPLSLDIPEDQLHCRFHLLTHQKKWLTGKCELREPWSINTELQLRNPKDRVPVGTSGSPVFNDAGQVIGIVNKAEKKHALATMAFLATALPKWILLKEIEAQLSS
jgi:hypothetical protein